MNRRRFARTLGISILASGLGRASFGLSANSPPRIAVTMDDPGTGPSPKLTAEERNRAILGALRANSSLKAALFVCGKRVDSAEGRQLLRAWDVEGHTLANHSYSHLYYHSAKVSTEAFAQDILRGEAVVKEFRHFTKLFRYPYLKEGDSVGKRDAARAFLKQNGYRNGHVTIDASDWYVDERMRGRLGRDPNADLSPYREFYLNHIWERATFYEGLARRVLGRTVSHTILIHHNLLNALYLGDLLRMFKSRGWKLINADEAFRDPVFASAPNIVPAGESIVWALAKETGKFENLLRYPGEDGRYEKDRMDKLGL